MPASLTRCPPQPAAGPKARRPASPGWCVGVERMGGEIEARSPRIRSAAAPAPGQSGDRGSAAGRCACSQPPNRLFCVARRLAACACHGAAPVDGGERCAPVAVQAVEGAGLDQGLEQPPVEHRPPLRAANRTGRRTARRAALGDQRLHRLRADAPDRGQRVADRRLPSARPRP